MLKVFIADDDNIIRQGIRAIIEKKANECQVIGEAPNGQLALDAIAKQDVDLLITDIKMPVMDGIELIKRVKEIKPKVRIIALSGFDDYKYVREVLTSGATDYLLKAIDKNALLDLLEKIKNDISEEKRQNGENARFSRDKLDSSLLEERFLLDIIKENNNILNNKARLEEFGLSKAHFFLFADVRIDDYYKIKNKDSSILPDAALTLLKTQIISISKEREKFVKVLIAARESGYVLLFLSETDFDDAFEDNVFAILVRLKEVLKEKKFFTISIGTSIIFNELEYSHAAYHQSEFALLRRFYEGKDRIIRYVPEDNFYNSIKEKLYDEQIDLLLNFIELGEANGVRRLIKDLFEAFMASNFEPGKIRELLTHIIARIEVISIEFKDASEIFYHGNADYFFYIAELDTIEELGAYLTYALSQIIEKINLMRSERSKKTIEIAKTFMQKNYNKDINLNVVAEKVFLAPFYFSNLFKKETGKSFTDFLMETRINEAKKLLVQPGIKVYEVGGMVGYEEPESFSRAFKKIVGVSPAEYRKILK